VRAFAEEAQAAELVAKASAEAQQIKDSYGPYDPDCYTGTEYFIMQVPFTGNPR
jgi:hypothetical protein